MSDELTLFEAWSAPGWPELSRDLSIRVLPPARVGSGGMPDVALAVPELRSEHVERLAEGLADSREGLLARPALDIARSLGRVGERFLARGDPLREEALAALPATAGVSPAMARAILDGMARDWTTERLTRLLRRDFEEPAVLDRFVPVEDVRLRAMGAALAFHLSAGSVPGVSATSLIRSLLVKTPALLKPGRGDVALSVLFLRGLEEVDPDLARSGAVVYWPGGGDQEAVEDALLERADLLVLYGGDEVVRTLRARIPASTRLVAYHHRVSFVVLGADALTPDRLAGSAAATARAVALFDQRGCVSPHAVFAELSAGAADLMDALADALAALDDELPPGRMDEAEASALHQIRGTAEMRAGSEEGVELRSGGASPWTVLLEPDPPLLVPCLNRSVRVVPVECVAEVPTRVRGLSRHLQSVGVAGIAPADLEELAEGLARVGVLRVTGLEAMPFPSAWWRHDGRGPLRALVRWVELEEGEPGVGG